MTLHGFIPVLTHRFPLDALLTPYVERYAPAALISAAELRAAPGAPLPALPLMIDSGGYQALDAHATVVDTGPFAALHVPGAVPLTPLDVYDLQRSARAAVCFTLDFPSPATATTDERVRRLHLGERNALWALSQIRPGTLYASVQPGQDLTAVLAARPDGIALGGLAPHSADRDRLRHEIRTVRAQLPAGLPLHVFGLGHPDSIHAALSAGATTVDSSSPQRMAASGRAWTGEVIPDAAPHERLRLAVTNLLTALHADVPLALHPAWRPLTPRRSA